jgi:hypothetical protein
VRLRLTSLEAIFAALACRTKVAGCSQYALLWHFSHYKEERWNSLEILAVLWT